jgi:predicted nuclease of predicted toxin-antitoxin system
MRFLVDAQLPPALARWLVTAGHEAEHVADRGMQSASDAAIWDLALQENAAILTKDEDFARRRALTGAGPTVVWDQASQHASCGIACLVRGGAAADTRGIGARRNADRDHLRCTTRRTPAKSFGKIV